MLELFAKLVFYAGTKLRNPSYFDALATLKKTDFYTRPALRSIQEKRLNDLLRFVFLHSPYHRSNLSSILGSEFKEIQLEDLHLLPIVSKGDLIQYNADIHTYKSYNFKKLFYSETSGTDGKALTFFKDERWDSYNRASIARGLNWHGVNPWERNGYLWGYSFSIITKLKTSLMDALLNRFRIFSYQEKDLNKFLYKLSKARYLSGYSSMIYEVAKLAEAKNVKLKLKLVKGTSEKIYDHYHSPVINAFGGKIVSEYGAAEAGIIAFECCYGAMHINEETCIVEEVDGEILVTNLLSYSFPIIRYKLGDMISLSDSSCKCGRHRKIISSVLGRVGKNIIGADGARFPSLTLYYVFKRLAVEHDIKLNYRAEQTEPGRLLIKIAESIDESIEKLLHEVCADYFRESLEIKIVHGVQIHTRKGKFKDFYSTLE